MKHNKTNCSNFKTRHYPIEWFWIKSLALVISTISNVGTLTRSGCQSIADDATTNLGLKSIIKYRKINLNRVREELVSVWKKKCSLFSVNYVTVIQNKKKYSRTCHSSATSNSILFEQRWHTLTISQLDIHPSFLSFLLFC